MTTLAVLCSGQGGQGPGMFDLVADAPEAAAVFAAATEVLDGRDPREIVASDSSDLHVNALAQILCCTQALAVWSVLQPQLDVRLIVAGYSVGEVAAWGVAGALSARSTLEVTARRAALMDAATKVPSGLLAVRGLGNLAVEHLCRETDVFVAIRNAPDRVILGGTLEALACARDEAEKAGAAGMTPLPVGVPSHTPLLRDAAKRFGDYLKELQSTQAPQGRLLSGIDGSAVFDIGDGLEKLGSQVARTIEWSACLESCRSFGATRALELGPGDGLARMMGDVIGSRDSRSVAEFRSLGGLLCWLGDCARAERR